MRYPGTDARMPVNQDAAVDREPASLAVTRGRDAGSRTRGALGEASPLRSSTPVSTPAAAFTAARVSQAEADTAALQVLL